MEFVWSGENSEKARSKASLQLLSQIKNFENQKISYHLVGHSHGGSVILGALAAAEASQLELDGIGSISTVGTPFLYYRASTLPAAWFLVSILSVSMGFYYLPELTQVAISFHNLASSSIASSLLGYVLLSAAFLVLSLSTFAFSVASGIRAKHFINRQDFKSMAVEKYGSLWICLAHNEDEPIHGLRNSMLRPPAVLRISYNQDESPWAIRTFWHVIDRAFLQVIDQTIWLRTMAKLQGNDIGGIRLTYVGSLPPELLQTTALGVSAQRELSQASSDAIATSADGVRKSLALYQGVEATDVLSSLKQAVGGNELIHNLYFDNEQVASAILHNITCGRPQLRRDQRIPLYSSGSVPHRKAMPSGALFGGILLGVPTLCWAILSVNSVIYQNYLHPHTLKYQFAQAEKISMQSYITSQSNQSQFGDLGAELVANGRLKQALVGYSLLSDASTAQVTAQKLAYSIGEHERPYAEFVQLVSTVKENSTRLRESAPLLATLYLNVLRGALSGGRPTDARYVTGLVESINSKRQNEVNIDLVDLKLFSYTTLLLAGAKKQAEVILPSEIDKDCLRQLQFMYILIGDGLIERAGQRRKQINQCQDAIIQAIKKQRNKINGWLPGINNYLGDIYYDRWARNSWSFSKANGLAEADLEDFFNKVTDKDSNDHVAPYSSLYIRTMASDRRPETMSQVLKSDLEHLREMPGLVNQSSRDLLGNVSRLVFSNKKRKERRSIDEALISGAYEILDEGSAFDISHFEIMRAFSDIGIIAKAFQQDPKSSSFRQLSEAFANSEGEYRKLIKSFLSILAKSNSVSDTRLRQHCIDYVPGIVALALTSSVFLERVKRSCGAILVEKFRAAIREVSVVEYRSLMQPYLVRLLMRIGRFNEASKEAGTSPPEFAFKGFYNQNPLHGRVGGFIALLQEYRCRTSRDFVDCQKAGLVSQRSIFRVIFVSSRPAEMGE